MDVVGDMATVAFGDGQSTHQAQPGLVARVMRAVNDRIHGEGLKPGEALPSEAAIAVEMKVSRVVVREAFRSLSALGIIEVGNGRRARVGSIDAGVIGLILDHAVQTDQVSIQQIYDVRRTIEMRTVALAALRRTSVEAAEITRLANAMFSDMARMDRVMAHDIAFHEAIGMASRNPLFSLIVSSFSVVTRQTWQISWTSRPTDDLRLESIQCHQRIAAAIAGQDQRIAGVAMAEHFDHSVKALLAAGVI
jgi:GntR family transcriptional regulator, transcriptional repressor for pyruvate dehydrogenase complex